MEATMTQRDEGFRDYDQMQQGDDERQTSHYQEGRERSVATTGEHRQAERQGGGRWKGYVVPYRYYGPGYRGVGYYSVAYLGPDESQGAGSERGTQYEGGRGSAGGWSGQDADSPGGGYAGRGPKGYRRSDERIREDISDRLMESEWIDASDVEVNVSRGEVTLSGTVDDRSAKRLAEDIVEDVMGVREVMNQLRVKGATEQDASGQTPSGQPSRTGTTTQRSGTQRSEANGKRQRATAR
jgi:osmotically-inducible protein OsmY